MEPISIILDALAIGLKETAPEIVREAYNNLKQLIRMKLVDKPDAQMVLTKYESNPKPWRDGLKEELINAGVDRDKAIFEAAQRLMQRIDVGEVKVGRDFIGRDNIGGDVVGGNKVGGDSIGGDKAGGNIDKSRKTRFSFTFLGLLVLALSGLTLGSIVLVLYASNPTYLAGETRVSQCEKLLNIINRMNSEVNQIEQSGDQSEMIQLADVADQHVGLLQAVELSDQNLEEYRTRFTDLFRELSQGQRAMARIPQPPNEIQALMVMQYLMALETKSQQYESLYVEFDRFCYGN